tara:strand:- start:344 stop:577 length:234 start_codon:yes stop_codon:yes gene_type:complete
MNKIYKQLMKQHGGSIPFSVMKRINQKTHKKTTKKTNKKRKRYKTTHKVKSMFYPGTIIRKRGILYKYTNNKQWIKM